MKYLPVEIFRADNFPDASNKGPTSQEAKFFIQTQWEHGSSSREDLDFLRQGGPVYILKPVTVGERGYTFFTTLDMEDRCTMFGGCFAWSSDSRFREKYMYPVPIHDRVE